jgi:hypothetical protein
MKWSELTTQQLSDYLEGMDQDAAQGIGSSEEYEGETMGIWQELDERGATLHQEKIELEAEHMSTEDYHTGEDIMRMIEKIDTELTLINRLRYPRA